MPALTPKTLYIGNGTASNVYTVTSTSGNYTIIKNINVCNANTSTAKSISINIIPPAGTAVENNLYLSNLSIPANTSIQIDTSLILGNSYSIYVTHTGNVSTIVTGVEYV